MREAVRGFLPFIENMKALTAIADESGPLGHEAVEQSVAPGRKEVY